MTNTGSESDDFNLSGAVTISVVLWQSHEAVRINCTDQRKLILMCVQIKVPKDYPIDGIKKSREGGNDVCGQA